MRVVKFLFTLVVVVLLLMLLGASAVMPSGNPVASHGSVHRPAAGRAHKKRQSALCNFAHIVGNLANPGSCDVDIGGSNDTS